MSLPSTQQTGVYPYPLGAGSARPNPPKGRSRQKILHAQNLQCSEGVWSPQAARPWGRGRSEFANLRWLKLKVSIPFPAAGQENKQHKSAVKQMGPGEEEAAGYCPKILFSQKGPKWCSGVSTGIRYFRKPLRGPPTHGVPKSPSNEKGNSKNPENPIILQK